MNDIIRKQLRIAAGFWIAGMLLLIFLVVRGIGAKDGSSALIFLFSRRTPAVSEHLQPLENPVPVSAPAPQKLSKELPADQPLSKGRKSGSGYFGSPTISQNADSNVVIFLPLQGTVGEYENFYWNNGRSVVLDFYGIHSSQSQNREVKIGAVRFLQIADHGSFTRISLTSGTGKLTAQPFAKSNGIEIRIAQ
ncbi:MAG: hypothetical protein PUB69_06335 [Desulfovibrionaceae bacterium]|nr:hypothetical protein [Desulfovibrionaceae bacterium]